MITIYIDKRKIVTEEGANLLQVALDNGIKIPNLCYSSKISLTGACRLCIVKIEGRKGFIASCSTVVEQGMRVTAFDESLEESRRNIIDMIFSTHNDDCISCVKDGDCKLQDLAFRYNLARDERRLRPVWQDIAKRDDTTSPVLNYDASKCIQCEKCVKACYELQGKGVISSSGRGIASQIVAGFSCWNESECDGCGECIQICPVGAITRKPASGYMKRIRKKDIDRTVQTTCPYCGVGCQLNIEVKDGSIVGVQGADDIPNYAKICVKGRFGLDFVEREERLKKPLIKKNGKFTEVSFEEAINYTAKRLNEIKLKHGSDAIAGLSSARCTNEENFVFQKFMRTVIGTNNVDHCARLCHSSTVAGLAAVFGSGAMTNSIEELEFAKVILVTGSNTTEAHPVIATLIKRAVLFHDAKLIVVDPRKIDLVPYAALWLRQNNGTDVAWINGLMHVIVKENLQDAEFITKRTEGFERIKSVIEKYTPEEAGKITGINASDIIKAARLYAGAESASIVYAMGITQHTTGTDNVKSLANLALLTGNLGKKNTGVNPLRGQNNVQGACDMGALPNVYPGYQKVTDSKAREKFEKAWGVKLSDKNGLTVTEIIDGAARGGIKALLIMGENPMVSDPNITHVRQALEKVDFLVSQDIFMNETTELADVIFPAASFAEKQGTYTNTERRILPIRNIIKPIGESRPDWQIIDALAHKMDKNHRSYESVKDILDEINSLTPQYAGITYERIANGEKLQWPCPLPDHPGTKFLHKEKFVRGKGLFSAIEYFPAKELPSKDFPFVLSTGRNLFQYHTGTMSRKTKVLPQYNSGPYVEINRKDLRVLQVKDGDKIRVVSRRGSIELEARETFRVAAGNIFIPFHFAEAAANMLTNDAVDPVAKIPEYKVCACRVEKI